MKMGVSTYDALILEKTLENVLLVQGYLASQAEHFKQEKKIKKLLRVALLEWSSKKLVLIAHIMLEGRVHGTENH